MIRRILAAGILLVLTVSAGAQDTVTVQAFPTLFEAAMFALSPDGSMMAVYENAIIVGNEVEANSLPILLIDTETGEEIGHLEGAQVDFTRSAAFSPDNTQFTSYHFNGDLIVWDVATQEAEDVYDWLPFSGGPIEYLPDGQSLTMVTYGVGIIGQHLIFDLTTGSITDILSLRPDTFAELNEQSADTLSMSVYSVVAQAVGPDGKIYGATANGDVYRWNTETRLRELVYPASDERPLRYPVRQLQVLDDGTLAFLDSGTGKLVQFAPDGIRTEYTLNGMKFAASEDGFVVAYDPREDGLYSLDLNSDSPEPQRLEIDLGVDAEGEAIELEGDPVLAFTPDGDLIVGGIHASGGDSAVYIVDLP